MYFSNRFILLTLASSLGLDAKDNAAKPKDSLNVAAHENNAGVSSSAEPIKHFQGFEKNDLLCDRQHNTSVLVTKKDIVRRIRDVVARGVVSKSGTDAKHKYQSNAESACSSLRSKSPIPLYNTTVGPGQQFWVEWAWDQKNSVATICMAAAIDTALSLRGVGGIWPCHAIDDSIVLPVESIVGVPKTISCPRMLDQADVTTDREQIIRSIKGSVATVGRRVHGKCTADKYLRMSIYQTYVENGAIQAIFAFDPQTGTAEYCEAVATDAKPVPDTDDKEAGHIMEGRCVETPKEGPSGVRPAKSQRRPHGHRVHAE